MRYPSCADLPSSLARALVILSSLSSKSFRTARNCCILHSFVLVIPLLIVWLSSSTICGTRTTVSSSCWVAIPLAPQLETPKSAQIQATKAHPLDLENSPKFSTNITNAADQQTKFETTFKFYSKLFSNSSTQTLFKFYSDFIQILLKLFSNSSTQNSFQILFRFLSNSTQIIFKFFYSKLFSNSIQISFKFYSNYFQILLLKTLFKFYSDFIQILLNYFQILLRFHSDSTQKSENFATRSCTSQVISNLD